MASTTFAKATYCLAGAGVLLGGGYAAKTWIIGDKIEDLLKVHNPKHQLLTTNSSVDRWKKVWFKYREDNKSKDKDTWNLAADWKKEAKIDKEARAPSSFIDACENKAQERVTSTEDPLYKEVLEWCTGEAKIRDLIRDSGKRALTDKDPKEDDKYGWKPLLKKYLDSHKSDNPLGIDTTSITSEKPLEDKELMKRFMDKCKELSDKEVVGTTDPTYEKVNLHCSANIRAEDIVRESYPDKALVNLDMVKKNKNSSLAESMWSRYKNDKKDPWKVIPSTGDGVMSDIFLKKCEDNRKKEVQNSEDETFKEVLRYCAVDRKQANTYAEEVK